MEHYKKEIERAKRFENTKVTGAGGQGGEKIVVKKRIAPASNGTAS